MLSISSASLSFSAAAPEPNPPNWPASVTVCSADDAAACASSVDAAFATNGGHDPPNHGQFSSSRYAFLFKPGKYTIDVPVGFYTQVLGLGASPEDVVFAGDKGVYCEEGDYDPSVGALDNFWRGAENFANEAMHDWGTGKGMLWAVSQASPLRRVKVAGDLSLYEYISPYPNAGFASGGFMANSQVGGALRTRGGSRTTSALLGDVSPGSQQQWMTRNCAVSGWDGGVWNMVFVGTDGAPAAHCGPPSPMTTVAKTPVIAEKPFITIDSGGKYTLRIPKAKSDSAGVDWSGDDSVPFDAVYVASANDTAAAINAKLSAGLHVVLSPGIYKLDAPLQLSTHGQVLLGLGLATLVATNGTPAVVVGNVDGVRVGGVLLQAGSGNSPTLLQWGDGTYAGNSNSPSFFHDVFIRVGGPDSTPVQASTMMLVQSGHVVGDNAWLWRADHTATGPVTGGANPCATGLKVSGDDVTMYGLAVEHTLQDLTVWTGERGAVYFYQSELPYDVDQKYGDSGYAGYRVGEGVASHDAWGVGVYHFFRDNEVTVPSGIVVPDGLVDRIRSPLSVYLSGEGTMEHIINDKGNWTSSKGGGGDAQYYCGGA